MAVGGAAYPEVADGSAAAAYQRGRCRGYEQGQVAAARDANVRSSWDMLCPEKWRRREYDEELPIRRTGEPFRSDDESDGSCSASAPSDVEDDPRAEETRNLSDDDQWPRSSAAVVSDAAKVPEADMEHLRQLEVLLGDADWHPAAIPVDAKRCLMQYKLNIMDL